jgi:hypothetical protein
VGGLSGSGTGPPEAVRCPTCGAGSHPAASSCAGCGAPLRAPPRIARAVAETAGGRVAPNPWTTPPPAPVRGASTPTRWEYVDAAIPVGLYPLEPGFLDAFDQAMTLALLEYGRDGWEPASPVEWREVVATGRFVPAMRQGPIPLLRFLGERPMVTEVAVRFRRAA